MGKVLESEFEECKSQTRRANSIGCKNKNCVFYTRELENDTSKLKLRIGYLEMELERHGIRVPS